jgi:hypothetical protein
MIHKTRDASFKTIFANNELFAEFLRDFVSIEVFNEVRPGDIKDESAHFADLDRESKDSDIVKRVRLRSPQSEKTPEVYAIALVENQSTVDFSIVNRVSHYIDRIYERYERAQMAKGVDPRAKDFRYPLVIPIVLYDGEGAWTAALDFQSRVAMREGCEDFVPQFKYILVNLRDMTIDSLVRHNDALSFLFILDKIRDADEVSALKRLPPAYLEMVAGLPGPLKRVIAQVAAALLGKLGVPKAKIDHVVKMFKPRKVSKMFEVLERNVKAERDAWQNERNAWKTERDNWQARETQLQRRIAELEGRC